jgi:transcriptional regulator with XRE-family HTH domain
VSTTVRSALLIERRKDVGLTQQALIERLGQPQSYVAKYELGERRVDVVEFIEIARGLDADPLKLLGAMIE